MIPTRSMVGQNSLGIWSGYRLRMILYLLTIGLMLPKVAVAHGGGVPRLEYVTVGAYRMSAWTQPEPWVKDELGHLSLIVTVENKDRQGASLDQPVKDAIVNVTFRSANKDEPPINQVATLSTEFAGIFYETEVALPSAGVWQVQIAVNSAEGAGQAEFMMDVLAERLINWWLVVGGSIIILLLTGASLALLRVQQNTQGTQQSAMSESQAAKVKTRGKMSVK